MFLDNVPGEVLIQHFHIIFGNTKIGQFSCFQEITRRNGFLPYLKEVRNNS